MKLEIKKIGNSTGIILPKELLLRLGLAAGDTVVVNETPDGIALTRGQDDAEFERGLEIARKAMKDYHETLKKLAE